MRLDRSGKRAPSLPRSGEVSYRNVFRLHFLSAAGWKSFFEGEASLFGTYRGNFGYLKVARLLVNRIPVFKANDEWRSNGQIKFSISGERLVVGLIRYGGEQILGQCPKTWEGKASMRVTRKFPSMFCNVESTFWVRRIFLCKDSWKSE